MLFFVWKIVLRRSPMNEVIERIYRTGQVEDAQGNVYRLVSSVTYEVGIVLYQLVRALKPSRTVEVGMAYGLSTLFICQGLRDNGSGHHTAIDPLQEARFKTIGLLNMERASLKSLLRFYQAPSDEVLPQLRVQNERFDFAFIDGNHRFDYTLVDFFYLDKLLDIGGHIALDDLWIPSVRKVASFILKNMPYELVRPPSTRKTPAWKWGLRVGRRILQNPLGRDWALKCVPENIAVFKKISADQKAWRHDRAF
jgi:predicted O-methyltransferase YrrM